MQNRRDEKEAFREAGTTETRNSGNLQMPASPYQVIAGTVVAGALVTGIKSNLPGDVIATVTEPVYDTAPGRFILIPHGSRILGVSLTLDNLVGADPAGHAGLEDGVDHHWGRIFAGAALTTLLGVGAELAAPENRIHEADLCLPGQPESRPRSLRHATPAGVWRGRRCCDADPVHAGGVRGRR